MSLLRSRPEPPRVLIVGAGLAGLASAVSLAGRDLRVSLVESRPRLGGRASSFRDASSGELVDNAQHVSMGCCTNLADFSWRVGIRAQFRRESEVVFLAPDGREGRLKAGGWPAPLHLAPSFLRFPLFSLREKLTLARAFERLRRPLDGPGEESFGDWLQRHGQPPRLISWFWEPLLVSALNERLDRMDREYARKVLVDGLLRHRDGYILEIPRVPLGELYGTRMESWLERHGVELQKSAGVREVLLDEEGSARGVSLRDGSMVEADLVVLAVPFDRVAKLLPAEVSRSWPALGRLSELRSTPITGIHLWLDRPVCPVTFAVTPGRTIQWVFNHTSIRSHGADDVNQTANGPEQYLQMVVSAAYALQTMEPAQIRDLAIEDLRVIWPAARGAIVKRWRVVTEHGATFSVRPGVDTLRPPQRTPIDGLFLAGDWTATGWPATMEGAVRSGYLAAEEILQVLGRPQRILVPDLPTHGLARWAIRG
jgi:squalene-associated FAD-dependent desaturase